MNVEPEVRRKLFVIENKLQQKVDSRIRRSKGNESDSSTTSNRSLDRKLVKDKLVCPSGNVSQVREASVDVMPRVDSGTLAYELSSRRNKAWCVE